MEFVRLNLPATEKFDEVFVDHDDCNDNNGRYVNISIWLKNTFN